MNIEHVVMTVSSERIEFIVWGFPQQYQYQLDGFLMFLYEKTEISVLGVVK